MMNRIENIFCGILRSSLSEKELLDISGMSSEDWSSIYKIAWQNNLLPLLYCKLNSHKIPLPVALRTTLRTDYLVHEVRDMRRKKQLLELIRIFNDHNVNHILLKGSHLAEKVYFNSALRPMCDIDVLIQKSEFKKTYEILIQNGYVSSNANYYDFDIYSINGHYPCLVKADCIPIELHWNIHELYNSKNIEDIWSRSESVSIGDLKTKVLSPEDILLHLSVHKGCDLFISSFLVLNDINEICSRHKIDWEKLLSLASSKDWWGNTKCLFSALYLCDKLLGVSIPEHFLRKIQPADFNKKLLINQLFTGIGADNYTYNAVSALTKLILTLNPLLIFEYLMSPRKICRLYNREYSWGILPYLYCKRIIEKSVATFTVLTGFFKNSDMKKLYAASKASSKFESWLKS
ncbi:MAG: hypothetical protein A2017_11480 [Lentisphaerae bacterium GWF2_44_16]|nr:MAG: hypothetical protein A2017_11480 [Lentisphaerae bacterium GWF2_44_16]